MKNNILLSYSSTSTESRKKFKGFTLIEVLLALAIVAIALTALLRAISQDVTHADRIKEKSISHWVAMQGITALQLGLINAPLNQDISQVTTLFGQRWYWRAKLTQTKVKKMQQISIMVSNKQAGPFSSPLIGYRYVP